MGLIADRSSGASVALCAPRITLCAGQPLVTDRIAVLVVEDEPLMLLDIVDQLHKEGFGVYEAMNAPLPLVDLTG